MPEQARTASASRWVTGVFALGTLSAAAATGLASPASADTGSYLNDLQPRYAFLTASQLTAAGESVCSGTRRGLPASDIVPMLVKDYGLSVSAAYEITVSAIKHLDC